LRKDSARRSVAACEKAGVVLGIGHERRFEPALKKVKQMIDNGELGTVMHAESAFSHDKLINVPSGDWRTLKETAPAAAMTGMGIHLTDLYISYFGPVKTVQALTANRVLDWETFIRLHVFGSKAAVEVRNDTHPDTPGGIAQMVVSRTDQKPEVENIDWTDTVVENLEAFADAVAGVTPYPYTHEQLIGNIVVLEAITESAETGKTIHLSQGRMVSQGG